MNFNTSKYLAEFLEYRNSFSNAKKAYDYYIEACVRREKEIKNLQEENARLRYEIVEYLKEIKSLRLILQSHGEVIDMNYELKKELKELKQNKGSCFHCEEVALMNVKLEAENAKLKQYLKMTGIYDYGKFQDELKEENARLREALESISKNTCCEPCQEAKKVAINALERSERNEF